MCLSLLHIFIHENVLVSWMFFEIHLFYLHYLDSGVYLYCMDWYLKTILMVFCIYLKDRVANFLGSFTSFILSFYFSITLTVLTTVIFLIVVSFCFCKLFKKRTWPVFFHVSFKQKILSMKIFCSSSPVSPFSLICGKSCKSQK